MEIITLVKANIRQKKGSFFSIFLLMFFVSIVLTTVLSINKNVETRCIEAMEEVGIGDVVVIISDLRNNKEMQQSIDNNPDVLKIEVIRSITSKMTINEISKSASTFFQMYEPEKHPYQIYKEDGLSFEENPEDLKEGEIYVPISFSNIYKSSKGDTVLLKHGEETIKFTIKGFMEEPFLGAEMLGIKQVFISKADFQELYKKRITEEALLTNNEDNITGWDFVHIYQKKDSNLTIGQWKKDINRESKIIDFSLVSLGKVQSQNYTLMFLQIISGILYAFVVLLLLSVFIVIGHSISTSIEISYVNLGILKAQGVTKGTLRSVIIIEYLFAQILGILLGILGSFFTIKWLNQIFVPLNGILPSSRIALLPCVGILLGMILIGGIFIVWKTRKIANISPVRAISGGKDSIFFQSKLQIPIHGKWLLATLAYRQLISNKKQYISAGFIVAVLVFFMISITTLDFSLNGENMIGLYGGYVSDIEVTYLETEDIREQVEKEIEKITQIENKFKVFSAYFTLEEQELLGISYSDTSLYQSITKGRAPRYKNEIIITEIIADELGKQIGDTVTVASKEKEVQYIICGMFQFTADAGRAFGFTMEGIRQIEENADSNQVQYDMKESQKSGEILKQLEEKFPNQIEVVDCNQEEETFDTILTAINSITFIVYILSVIFVIIVVSMVCSKLYLKEKQDLGIYKAIGFTTRNLRIQFAFRFFFVSLIGSMIGTLANIIWNDALMGGLLRSIGITSYVTEYSLESLMLPIGIVVLCFILFAYLATGKIKKVNTRELTVE